MPAVPHGNATFQFPIRVYYEDTDTGGVVYYANYLKFFERARTEWLRTLGFGQAQMADLDGRIFVVRKASTEYRLPARLDDELMVHSQIRRVGRASLDFHQWCMRGEQLIAVGDIQVGCVQREGLRPAAMPKPLAARLSGLDAPPRHHPA